MFRQGRVPMAGYMRGNTRKGSIGRRQAGAEAGRHEQRQGEEVVQGPGANSKGSTAQHSSRTGGQQQGQRRAGADASRGRAGRGSQGGQKMTRSGVSDMSLHHQTQHAGTILPSASVCWHGCAQN